MSLLDHPVLPWAPVLSSTAGTVYAQHRMAAMSSRCAAPVWGPGDLKAHASRQRETTGRVL